ncbi:AraC family transcriptional regulator [Micrococcales bacterium 31B]|nr:AraC family transcriptional regulator [Micrococcales bacterium 31B]
MAEVISLSGLKHSDAIARYQAALASTLIQQNVEVRNPSEFTASIMLEQISGMRLAVIGSYPQVLWRDSDTGFTGEGQLYVHVQLGGRCVMTQGRNTVALRRGDMAVYDADRPFSIRFETEFTIALFVVPRSAVTIDPEDLERVAATNLNNGSELSRSTGPFLRDLAEQAVRLEGVHETRVADYASAMLVDLINDAVGNTVDTEVPLSIAARFIRAHCGNPELTVAEVAQAAGLSPRALHKLFQNNGTTVARYIHLQRLGRARALLREADPSRVDLEIIAQRVGFPDADHLIRVFTNNTGVDPLEWQVRNHA